MSKRKLKESDKKIIASNQEWKCNVCLKILPSTYQIDHIIPFSISNNDNIINLQALCANCHSKKTQQEYNRILKFKKLCSLQKKDLCWYCLSDISSFHKCDKELIPITIINSPKKINELEEFIFTGEENDDTLKIKISQHLIWVNNYFTDSKELTLEIVGKAVSISTKETKDINKYKNIEIDLTLLAIEMEEEISEEMIDFIEENLQENLPKEIFKNNQNITYIFLC